MQLPQSHILIVDDDNRILILLQKFFQQNDFLVSTANSVSGAEELMLYYAFDLMILDVMLPKITGIEFAKNIKASSTTTTMPVIMLTALTEPADRIRGLKAGALDYLTKPFEPQELLLRVNNLIKYYKQHKRRQEIIRFGSNFYNFKSKEFIKKGQNIRLTTSEQLLFEMLIAKLGKVISRFELASNIKTINWRSIDVVVARIRLKIEDNPKEPKYLKTLRGQGYVLCT